MTTLHAAAHPRVSLAAALATAVQASSLAGSTALLTSPTHYHVALLGSDGACRTPAGPVDLTPVFEARVFTPNAELRWREEESGGLGRVVLLTENPALLPSAFPEKEGLALHAADTLDVAYLLWGEATDTRGGWTTLVGASVRLTVPVPASERVQRVQLKAVQYIAAEPEHGNAHVADERLVRLEPYQPVAEPQEGDMP